jgi:hypothetical protein
LRGLHNSAQKARLREEREQRLLRLLRVPMGSGEAVGVVLQLRDEGVAVLSQLCAQKKKTGVEKWGRATPAQKKHTTCIHTQARLSSVR